jgi:hypothetical protein
MGRRARRPVVCRTPRPALAVVCGANAIAALGAALLAAAVAGAAPRLLLAAVALEVGAFAAAQLRVIGRRIDWS